MPNTSRPVKPLGDITVYKFDPTGIAPENKVVEQRTLTNENRTDYNHIIPFSAPFYEESLVIKHIGTDQFLRLGIDYYVVGYFLGAIASNIGSKPVAYAIVFDNPTITGEFELQYQTIGGDAVLDTRHYVELIANHMNNPLYTDWEEIIGRPIQFPPLPHPLDIRDTHSWDDVVDTNKEIAEAIRQLRVDESQANPSYAQLVTEMFRFNERLNGYDKTLEDFRKQQMKTLSGQVEDLNGKISALDEAYKLADRNLDAKFTGLISDNVQSLTNLITEKDTNLRELIETTRSTLNDKIDQKVTDLTGLISATKTELTQNLNTAKNQLNEAIEAAKTESQQARDVLNENLTLLINQKHTVALQKVTEAREYTDTSIQNLNVALTGNINQVSDNLNTEKLRINGILGRLNAPASTNEFVLRAGGQDINGRLTMTEGGWQVKHNDKTSTYFRTANSTTITHNADQADSKTFEIKDDGTAWYADKRLLNTDDYGTVDEKIKTVRDNIDKTLTPLINNNRDGLAALKARVDGNDELVKILGEQTITGMKTFKGGMKVGHSTDTNKQAVLSRQDTATRIIHKNGTSEKIFELRDNGEAWYNNTRLASMTDLDASNENITNLLRRVSAIEGNYVTTNTIQSITANKTFTGSIFLTHTDNFLRAGKLNRDGSDANTIEVNFINFESMYCRSDERVKTEIQPIQNALDIVSKLNGKTYVFNGTSARYKTAGVIAQELEKVLPELVSSDVKTGMKGVDYNALIGYLIEAIKEERSRRESLEDKVDELIRLLKQ